MEQRLIEEETAKRLEEMVNKRVEEELEKRKEEIEAEVLRRVEEAKREMEKGLMEEMERRRLLQIEEERKREVRTRNSTPRARRLFLSDVSCPSNVYISATRFLVQHSCWARATLDRKMVALCVALLLSILFI